MSTLFQRSSVPLWAIIVLIVFGSLCVLVTLAFVIRHLIVKKRARQPVADEFTAPTRMMTVRRGRVVPQSHYLSLTGSRFGVNELDNDVGTTRSKSPFEWWNRVNKRNGSEEDSSSQRGSVFGAPSISTNMSTNYDGETAIPSPALLHPSRGPPSPSSSPASSPVYTTFPRAYRSGTPGSLFAFDHRLSMIAEASPHHSVISSQSRQRSAEASGARLTGDGSSIWREPRRSPRLASVHTQLVSLPPYEETSSSSKSNKYRKSGQSLTSPPSTNINSWHDASQLNALPDVDELQTKEWPPQTSCLLSRSPSLLHPSSPILEQEMNSSQLPSALPTPDQRVGFPVRTSSTSKKGNVLRKKSLKNMQITNEDIRAPRPHSVHSQRQSGSHHSCGSEDSDMYGSPRAVAMDQRGPCRSQGSAAASGIKPSNPPAPVHPGAWTQHHAGSSGSDPYPSPTLLAAGRGRGARGSSISYVETEQLRQNKQAAQAQPAQPFYAWSSYDTGPREPSCEVAPLRIRKK
ncbi:hypothetical protein DV735_g697, partial [Chaetothyriales sp. CBS 134920]